jgi:shikimate kinase
MQWMNAHGTTIFLHASMENLYKNILQEKNKRPLLANISDTELEYFIQNKLDERLHYYALSKIILQQKDLNEAGFNLAIK